MLNKEIKNAFIISLFAILQEELFQLTMLISWTVYLLTGKELTILQSKLFLVLGTIIIIIIGLNSPVNYAIRIISLIYRLKKQYEDIRGEYETKEITEDEVPEAIREQIRKQEEAQM